MKTNVIILWETFTFYQHINLIMTEKAGRTHELIISVMTHFTCLTVESDITWYRHPRSGQRISRGIEGTGPCQSCRGCRALPGRDVVLTLELRHGGVDHLVLGGQVCHGLVQSLHRRYDVLGRQQRRPWKRNIFFSCGCISRSKPWLLSQGVSQSVCLTF